MNDKARPVDYAPVVIVTATIMDGQVVRWYRSVTAAYNHHEVVSVSRNGVTVRAETTTEEENVGLGQLIAQAEYTRRRLRSGQDCRDLATHTSNWANDRIEPVAS